MYILLPFFVFTLTLLSMALVIGTYLEYKEYRLKKVKSPSLPSFIKYIIFTKSKKASSLDEKFWWQDPYLYLGIILFIVIGTVVSFVTTLITFVGIVFLFKLFN